MHTPTRVLFLSEGNSVRSQMAEGFLKSLGGPGFDAQSAGLEPRLLSPLAAQVMAEVGIDISGQRAKHLNEFLDRQFDFVITLCDRSRDACPDFPPMAIRCTGRVPNLTRRQVAKTISLPLSARCVTTSGSNSRSGWRPSAVRVSVGLARPDLVPMYRRGMYATRPLSDGMKRPCPFGGRRP